MYVGCFGWFPEAQGVEFNLNYGWGKSVEIRGGGGNPKPFEKFSHAKAQTEERQTWGMIPYRRELSKTIKQHDKKALCCKKNINKHHIL